MRKYKQVKRKEVIFSLEKWKQIEKKSGFIILENRNFCEAYGS